MDLSRFDNSDFDRGAGRCREAAWIALRSILFLHCPLPCYRLRSRALTAFGARVGRGVAIKPGVNITFPWRLTIGNHCWLGEETWVLDLAPVTIGSNVCVSQRAFLCTGSHDWSDPLFRLTTAPIVIGDGAWICANVFVGPGVTVGKGAVATAGSVVTGDLPAGMICSGNPCVPVRRRSSVKEQPAQQQ